MKLLSSILIILPVLIWLVGLCTLWIAEQDSVYLIFVISNLFLCIFFLVFWKKKKSNVVKKNDLANALCKKTILIGASLIFVLALFMFVQLLNVSSAIGFDDARFVVRASPFFGFASRMIYWGGISLAPFAIYLINTSQRKMGLLVLVLLFLSSMVSGSKAGVVWLAVTSAISHYVVGLSGLPNHYSNSIVKKVFMVSFISMFCLFFLFSDDYESAIGGFLFRVGYGAVEGIKFAIDYEQSNGPSFPEFSLIKPVNLFLSTIRIVDKGYYTADTGVFLARYFSRINENASYTISATGLGYLELGALGVAGIVFVIGYLFKRIVTKILTAPQLTTRLFYIAWLIVLLHFCDWGWMDGIFVFAAIYVLFFHFLVFVVIKTKLQNKESCK